MLSCDVTELALKLLATAAAVFVFAVLGAAVLVLTPVRPRRPPEPYPDGRYEEEGRAHADGNIPVPPHTAGLHEEVSEGVRIIIYESRLSGEGVMRFYAGEMAARGWRPGEPFVSGGSEAAGVVRDTLYFTDGRRICIINIEEQDAFVTHFSVIMTAHDAR